MTNKIRTDYGIFRAVIIIIRAQTANAYICDFLQLFIVSRYENRMAKNLPAMATKLKNKRALPLIFYGNISEHKVLAIINVIPIPTPRSINIAKNV